MADLHIHLNDSTTAATLRVPNAPPASSQHAMYIGQTLLAGFLAIQLLGATLWYLSCASRRVRASLHRSQMLVGVLLLTAFAAMFDCIARAVIAASALSPAAASDAASLSRSTSLDSDFTLLLSRGLALLSACGLMGLALLRRGFLLRPLARAASSNPWWTHLAAITTITCGTVVFCLCFTYALIVSTSSQRSWPQGACTSCAAFHGSSSDLESAFALALHLDACKYPYITPFAVLISVLFAAVLLVTAPAVFADLIRTPTSTVYTPTTLPDGHESVQIRPVDWVAQRESSLGWRLGLSSVTASHLLIACMLFPLCQIMTIIPLAAVGGAGFVCGGNEKLEADGGAAVNAANAACTSVPLVLLITFAMLHTVVHARVE